MLFVYEIEVDERYRRRGIGKELMRTIAREAGAAEGFVLTEPDNEAANALYASLGGEPLGRRPMGLRVRGALTEVRPATEEDVELLVAWHADPDVARYWDDETFTPEQMRSRLARPDVDAYVVEAQGGPVGLSPGVAGRQRRRARHVPHPRGPREGPWAGRSASARAPRCVTKAGRASRSTRTCWNERAIAAWKRAGFEPVERRPADDEHTADWLLMEFG